MIMDKLKTALSKEHLMDAGAIFLGYVIAMVGVNLLTPHLAAIPVPAQFSRVLSAGVIVVMMTFEPIKTKYFVMGATIILINEILMSFGIDLIHIVGTTVDKYGKPAGG